MPVLTTQPRGVPLGKQLSQEVIDQYKQFIEDVPENQDGVLEFGEDENTDEGKEGLKQAADQLGLYLKISKIRSRDNALRFQQITKEEHEEAQKKAKERGQRMKGRTRGKAKAKKS